MIRSQFSSYYPISHEQVLENPACRKGPRFVFEPRSGPDGTGGEEDGVIQILLNVEKIHC